MNLADLRSSLWTGDQAREGLILLVGASPLPNLLTALALRPPKVALVCSEQTGPRSSPGGAPWGVEQLTAQIRAIPLAGADTTTELWRFGEALDWLTLASPHDPSVVLRNFTSANWGSKGLQAWVLGYTGGTKVMAGQALRAWYGAGGSEQHACYLADTSRTLFFDDGASCSLDGTDVSVSLGQLAALHGIEKLSKESAALGSGSGTGPTDQDTSTILAEVCGNPNLAGELYNVATFQPEDGERRPRPLKPSDLTSARDISCWGLSLKSVDRSLLDSKVFEAWVKYLRGTWLEAAVARFVSKAAAADTEVHRDVKGWLRARHSTKLLDFQVDAVHVRGSRVHAVSCTIAGWKGREAGRGEAKLKLFEVMERARQLGGGLARAGLVCLFPEGECSKLEDEIVRSFTGDEPRPRVWGKESLCEWASGNLASLKEWLDQ